MLIVIFLLIGKYFASLSSFGQTCDDAVGGLPSR